MMSKTIGAIALTVSFFTVVPRLADKKLRDDRNVANDVDWRADPRDIRDAPWTCSDFDDDNEISPLGCAAVDEAMCKKHCTSFWCRELCGESCDKHEGALCAYRLLSDLVGTCKMVQERILSTNMTMEDEEEIVHDSCAPRADTRIVNPPDNLFDPLNPNGYPTCDHHAWCMECSGNEACESVVPKARSAQRVESGGCAAASLGRIASICLENGLSRRAEKTPTRLRKVFYINCDRAKDRRKLQERHLSSLGVPYERVACVSGDTIDELTGRAVREFDHQTPEIQRAHTVGTWLSHYKIFDKIAQYEHDDPDGLYLVLEDDAILDPRFSIADIDRVANSLPENWAYASLNVHEAYCIEDRINEDWFLKRADVDASLFDTERIVRGRCTPIFKDSQWTFNSILYLSAAAQLLRPKTAQLVTAWLDAHPIYHIDAVLRTPNASTFPAFQSKENLFYTDETVSESRVISHASEP